MENAPQKDKMVKAAPVAKAETAAPAPRAGVQQTWHFPGSGEFVPQSVTAPTRTEAVKEWEKTRTSLIPTPSTPPADVVE